MKAYVWALLLLTGCNADTGDLEMLVDELEKRSFPPLSLYDEYELEVEPIPSALPVITRDPFSFSAASAGNDYPHSLLSSVLADTALEDIRMVGMLASGEHLRALVAASGSSVHPVSIGDHLGLRRTKVVAITEHGIRLEESTGAQRSHELQLLPTMQAQQ